MIRLGPEEVIAKCKRCDFEGIRLQSRVEKEWLASWLVVATCLSSLDSLDSLDSFVSNSLFTGA